MKSFLVFPLLNIITIFFVIAQNEITKIEGYYQDANPIIQNPFHSSGVGFCIFEITINGELVTDEINSNSFEIDLAPFNLKKGQEIIMLIKHKSGCTPRLVNSEVFSIPSTYKIVSIEFDKNSQSLNWTTTNENGKLPFIIQQNRWNKWANIGKVEGKGTPEENSYSFKVYTHSGNNRYRIKQEDYTKKPRYSQDVIYRSLEEPVEFKLNRGKNNIVFSRKTVYEIYDEYGRRITFGFSEIIDLSNFKKGRYYLNYDDRMDVFKI